MPFLAALFCSLLVLAPVAAVAETLQLSVRQATIERDPNLPLKILALELTDDSRATFADFTTRHVGKIVELSVGGDVLMAPRIVEPILGGKLNVSGNFAAGDLERIAGRITAGATLDATVPDQ